MNIMYLIFSFNIGGIERLLIDLCNEMDNRHENVCLCVINKDYTPSLFEKLNSNVEIILLDRPVGGTMSNITYMLRFASIVKRRKIDILHCQGINCVFFSAFAKLINPGLKIINTVHDSGNYPSYSTIKIFMQNRLCCHTIAISNSVRTEILKRNISPAKVTTIYNAIDTSRFTVNITKIFDPDHIKLGNVARIFPKKKGQDTLVQAVNILKNDYPSIHCSFAGEVFKGQESDYHKLCEYISKNDLEENISFLGNVNDIPEFLNNIDIFILPSRYEGFGIALIEALSCGIPCVASDIEGPKEIFSLSDTKLGYLTPTDDSIAIAKRIQDIIRCYKSYDPFELSSFIKSHFSIESMTDMHLHLYYSLIHHSTKNL